MSDDGLQFSLDSEEELLLWHQHIEENDTLARQKLIENYLPFSNKVSSNLYKLRTFTNVEYQDYIQYGCLGLIESVDRFQLDKNTSFKTFASYRIRGSILNGIAKNSEISSQVEYKKNKKKERLKSILKSEMNHDSVDDLLNEVVDITVILAIENILDSSEYENPKNIDDKDIPFKNYKIYEIKKQLNQIILTLSEKHRLVINYHYYGQLNFQDISEIMNLTKGRISQLHREALDNIQNSLTKKSILDIDF